MANEIFMRGRGLTLPQGKELSRVRVVLPCSSTRVLAAKRLQTSSAVLVITFQMSQMQLLALYCKPSPYIFT